MLLDQYGQPIKYSNSGMPVHKGAVWNPKRLNIIGQSTDTTGSVGAYSRDRLLEIGRWLYANDPTIHGAVNEKATEAAKDVMRMFGGKDEAWGDEASEYLSIADRAVDIRGYPFTMETVARALVIDAEVDGDIYPTMIRDETGQGRLQCFRAHRVKGADDDINLHDGVRVDEFGRPISYRVHLGDGVFKDIPAEACIPIFMPDRCDQKRGISSLATPCIYAQDVSESEAWELTAQKAAAGIAIIEENETGDPFGNGKKLIDAGTSPAANVPMVREELDGGIIQYLKSGSGASLKAFTADRPTANQAAFVERIRRSIFHSIAWPYEFYNLTLAGGAAMRVVMEKVNSTLDYVRQCAVYPLYHKFDLFRIACAIDKGILKPNKEWYKWTHLGAAPLTADAKYDSDVAINRIRFGLSSRQRECSKNRMNWKQVLKENVAWEAALSAECTTEKVDPNLPVQRLPNGNPPPTTEEPKETQSEESKEETAKDQKQ